MSCDFCKVRENIECLQTRIDILPTVEPGTKIAYCPVCGLNLRAIDTLSWLRETVEAEFRESIQAYLIENQNDTVLDENGEELIFERIPSEAKDGKPAPKPMVMTIDLDKVNIDREVCMMEEASGEQPWMTKYARERVREQIIEYMNEKGD